MHLAQSDLSFINQRTQMSLSSTIMSEPSNTEEQRLTRQLLRYTFPPPQSMKITRHSIDSSASSDSNSTQRTPTSPTTSSTHVKKHRRSRGLSLDFEFSNTFGSCGSLSTTPTEDSRRTSWSDRVRTSSGAGSSVNMIDLSEIEKPLMPSSQEEAKTPRRPEQQFPTVVSQRSGSFSKLMDVTEEGMEEEDSEDNEAREMQSDVATVEVETTASLKVADFLDQSCLELQRVTSADPLKDLFKGKNHSILGDLQLLVEVCAEKHAKLSGDPGYLAQKSCPSMMDLEQVGSFDAVGEDKNSNLRPLSFANEHRKSRSIEKLVLQKVRKLLGGGKNPSQRGVSI